MTEFNPCGEIRLLLACLFFSLLVLPGAALNAQLPDQFTDQLVVDNFPDAVGITFDESGQMYAWLKSGKVMVVQGDSVLPNPLLDISEEVGKWADHGLLGFALDPEFMTNGYFYIGYVVDRYHLFNFGSANYNPATDQYYAATIGRVTRYIANPQTNFTTLIPNSRKVLIGETPQTGIPILYHSHGMGSLLFGRDGSLLVSCGDGASFVGTDIGSGSTPSYAPQALIDGIIRSKEDIGAFRSQLIDGLNGKVLRINPHNGDGYPSNPFYDPSKPRSPASRVFALGLRNPFRCAIHTEMGSPDPNDANPGMLYIGDVGASGWEEINQLNVAGKNFGWPLYEGFDPNPLFFSVSVENPDAPNPLYGIGNCSQPFFNFQDLIQPANHQINPIFPNPCDSNDNLSDHTPTFFHQNGRVIYNNEYWNPTPASFSTYIDSIDNEVIVSITNPNSPINGATFSGIASIGGFIYQGATFPAEYAGSYFHGDYRGWIRNFKVDVQGELIQVDSFHTNSQNLVCMARNPLDDCLYYITHYPNEIHKVCFGGNPPPVAVANADSIFGPSPFLVNFSSLGSYDPLGEDITFKWEFDDGGISRNPNPSHTFHSPDNLPTSFSVLLSVEDSSGLISQDSLIISLNNTPPNVIINSNKDQDLFQIEDDTELSLFANVVDAEHDAKDLKYKWQVFHHHNSHYHPEPADTAMVAVTNIAPAGCGLEAYWYRIRLEVTDPDGLMGYDEIELFPWCRGPFVDFLDLRGEQQGSYINLKWTTNTDQETSYYLVERSIDDAPFIPVGQVQSTLTSRASATYHFRDENPVEGGLRYRVRAINTDDGFSFSDPISVVFSKQPIPLIFPNPFLHELNIKIPDVIGTAKFRIYNMDGVEIFAKDWPELRNVTDRISLDQIAPGLYFYMVFDGRVPRYGRIQKVN